MTKDIDIVFENEEQAVLFGKNMLKLGYEEVDLITEEYERLKTFTIIEKPDGFRFDVFIRSVCDGIVLSEGMKYRAADVELPGNFRLFIVSKEDIFLFKSITNREDDLADMNILTRARLDWQIIREELSCQPDQWRWNTIFFQNLVALEEEYSVLSPLRDEFEEKAEISVAMGLILAKLENRTMTRTEMVESLDEDDVTFTNTVINSLFEHNLIKEEDGIIFLEEKRRSKNNHPPE
jgi:hypothetical protein